MDFQAYDNYHQKWPAGVWDHTSLRFLSKSINILTLKYITRTFSICPKSQNAASNIIVASIQNDCKQLKAEGELDTGHSRPPPA